VGLRGPKQSSEVSRTSVRPGKGDMNELLQPSHIPDVRQKAEGTSGGGPEGVQEGGGKGGGVVSNDKPLGGFMKRGARDRGYVDWKGLRME